MAIPELFAQTQVSDYWQLIHCKHSGSFCDFLEAIKKTHEVTPKISLHLLKFYPDEQVLITTRPCEQGNWDTWMVLDPWNKV